MYVVEPKAYAPERHGDVFDAVLRDFFDTAADQLATDAISPAIRQPVEADLIVFPEAFLAAEDLIAAMIGFVSLRFQCCVHVGLRPDRSNKNHLFSRKNIESLLADMKDIQGIHNEDLEGFEGWFKKQRAAARFNLGCMFLVESNGSLRVCLHPKAVRAGVEYSALSDEHMTEAKLISLVTLVPPNSRYMSVTIQPLICADVLSLPNDSMLPNPIKAFSDSSAANFPRLYADHIDIVSLSLCTPVGEFNNGKGRRRRWKTEFESAFLEALKRDECFRHHFASFVMANFDEIGPKKGGLSGACVPAPFSVGSFPDEVSMWSYGKHKKDSADEWKCIAGLGAEISDNGVALNNKNRLNLVCLDDVTEPGLHVARALGFTMSRLIRDNPVGGAFPGLTMLDVRAVSDARAVNDEMLNSAEKY